MSTKTRTSTLYATNRARRLVRDEDVRLVPHSRGHLCKMRLRDTGRVAFFDQGANVSHRSPVELDVVVSGEGENHASHRRLFALAHEVKVQHSLW